MPRTSIKIRLLSPLQQRMHLASELFGHKGGPILVVLHGLFGSRWNWRSTAASISSTAGYSVMTVDLPCHADSPDSQALSISGIGDSVFETVAHRFGRQRFSLLGHSLGGKVAMQLAQGHSPQVERLVVVDIAPASVVGKERILRIADALERGERLPLADAHSLLRDAGRSPFECSFLRPKSGLRFRISQIRPNLEKLLSSNELNGSAIGNPTLLIRGMNSSYVPDESVADMRRLFPSLKCVTIPGAGHYPHTEAPTDFLDACSSFLKEGK